MNPRSTTRFWMALLLAGVAMWIAAADAVTATARASDSSSPPLPLRVDGTRILNSRNEPVRLRGVNIAGMEWSSDGEGPIVQSVQTAIQDWRVNVIRLPLAQDRWFGKAPEQKDGGASYRSLVKEIVEICAGHGCYIVLDLHWSDCGEWGVNIAQHSMPDENSVTFWKDCASAYPNHPAVIFDLYNEPHDVTWDVWLNGGTITEKPNGRRAGPPRTFEAVGMQELLDAVRDVGARNLVIVGGLDWAYDYSGILEGRQLSDPQGNGVLYANHAYNNKGHSVETWIARMERAARSLPVIVAEYGGSGGPHRRNRTSGLPGAAPRPGDDDWLLHAMQAMEDHTWSWIAWDFHPSAGPTLISGWDYAPTPDFGVFVQQALAGTLPRYTPPAAPPALPGSVDLRPFFEQWSLPRWQQGDRPTCSAFTVTGALEFAIARKEGRGTRLSVEFLNWAANQTAGDAVDGGFFSDLWAGFTRYGICSAEALPYARTFNPAAVPPREALVEAQTRLADDRTFHWIKEWDVTTGLTEAHVLAIKQTLANGWPVCAGLRWPRQERWVDDVLELCPPDAVRDGHSVLLTGYRKDPAQPGGGVFIFRNTANAGHDGGLPYAYARAYMNDAAWIE